MAKLRSVAVVTRDPDLNVQFFETAFDTKRWLCLTRPLDVGRGNERYSPPQGIARKVLRYAALRETRRKDHETLHLTGENPNLAREFHSREPEGYGCNPKISHADRHSGGF